MGKSKFNTFDDYLDTLSTEAGEKLKELREIILEVHPGAEELFSYGAPAFTLVPGGDKSQQVIIGGFKHHVGLYPSTDTIMHFADSLSRYKTSASTVQFPLDESLPRELIADMIRYTKETLYK